jgi:hypothetical protein
MEFGLLTKKKIFIIRINNKNDYEKLLKQEIKNLAL